MGGGVPSPQRFSVAGHLYAAEPSRAHIELQMLNARIIKSSASVRVPTCPVKRKRAKPELFFCPKKVGGVALTYLSKELICKLGVSSQNICKTPGRCRGLLSLRSVLGLSVDVLGLSVVFGGEGRSRGLSTRHRMEGAFVAFVCVQRPEKKRCKRLPLLLGSGRIIKDGWSGSGWAGDAGLLNGIRCGPESRMGATRAKIGWMQVLFVVLCRGGSSKNRTV